MPVDRGELRFRMSDPHRADDGRLLLPQRIDQDQASAGRKVIVEFGQLLVFAGYACQATFPSTKQRGYRNRREVHAVGDIRPEGLEYLQQRGADQSGAQADGTANQPGAREIQGFEVVTGGYVPLLEASLVPGYDVQEKIPDADRMQIVRNMTGAV
jgi:hypothetical protein